MAYPDNLESPRQKYAVKAGLDAKADWCDILEAFGYSGIREKIASILHRDEKATWNELAEEAAKSPLNPRLAA